MVGAGFALLGAVAAEAVRRAEHPRPRGSRRLALAVAAFPLTLLRETGLLVAVLLRTPRGGGAAGTMATIRLAPEVDAACAAALLSASPGACVIDIVAAGEDDGAGDAGEEAGDAGPGDATGRAEGRGPGEEAPGEPGAPGGACAGTPGAARTESRTGTAAGTPGEARRESPRTAHDLTVHLLSRPPSAVERALGGRRLR
jgi:hypothetical protein